MSHTSTNLSDPQRTVEGMTTTLHLSTCPDWCTAADDGPRHEIGEAAVTHPGPRFGPFGTDAEIGEDHRKIYSAFLTLGPWGAPGFDDAAQLREFAAQALAAAEWLEAHQ